MGRRPVPVAVVIWSPPAAPLSSLPARTIRHHGESNFDFSVTQEAAANMIVACIVTS
jgi:hypothetical protein